MFQKIKVEIKTEGNKFQFKKWKRKIRR